MHWLYENGRGFAERKHVHTVLFDYLASSYRDEDPVPIQLALDHGYAGIAMVAVDRVEGVGEQQFLEWTAASEAISSGPIATISTWRPQPRDEITGNAPMDLGTAPGGEERLMQLLFLEGDVESAWSSVAAYAEAVDRSGLGRVRFAGPFHRTVVGTDRYADQLWS